MFTISPNHSKAALMNSSTAKKAMRLAAMLATSPTEAAAPLLAASRMFCSSLGEKRPRQAHVAMHLHCEVGPALWMYCAVCTPQGLPTFCHLPYPNYSHNFPAVVGCV